MSYPDKYPRDSFTVHVSITHEPSGLKFVQSAGRIMVLKQLEFDGIWSLYSDFTNTDLQEFGVVLTEAQLIRAAITWLKDNVR